MQQYPHTNFPQQSYPGRSIYSQPGQSMPSGSPQQLVSRKPKRWPWIVATVVALIIGYAVGSTTSSGDTTTTTTTARASVK